MLAADQKLRLRKAQLQARRTGDTRELERLYDQYKRMAAPDDQADLNRAKRLLQLMKANSMNISEQRDAIEQLVAGLTVEQRREIYQIAGYNLDDFTPKKKKRRKRKKKKVKADESEPDEPTGKTVDLDIGHMVLPEAMRDEPEPDEPDESFDLDVGNMCSIETMMNQQDGSNE